MNQETHERYPQLRVDLGKLRENITCTVERCRAQGITVAAIVKGFHGLPHAAHVYDQCGCDFLGTSRSEQLRELHEAGIQTPLLMIRVPMLSALGDVVRYAQCSLQSDLTVLRAANAEAGRQNKRHQVILMADLGDLREGFWGPEELVEAAVEVETRMPHLELLGVGTNLGCYGAIAATRDKLDELVCRAEQVERAIGRRLTYISGGASSSFPRILEDNMPPRINMLRLGEIIINGRIGGEAVDFLHQDVFTLRAEVIERRRKATYPVGQITVDAFGKTPLYIDRGVREKALLGVGKVDYGDPFDLMPTDPGIEVMGASSDHTILDVEDSPNPCAVGETVDFLLKYGNLVYMSSSHNMQIKFIEEEKKRG